MAGPGSRSVEPLMIRDRRELPFFQVRVRAVQAVRTETCGPRRLRAIGFYALLCQLANEQRHSGAHRVVRVSYDALAERGQMSKRSVKLLLDALERAGVIRYERHNDRVTGGVIGLVHLLICDEPWIAITVAMADHLAAPRAGGHLLRDLGLVVVFLEFCAEQREQHGGLAAEVMRGEVAKRAGLTVDGVDDCNRVLEQAGVLEVLRRRASNGGRYLPSVYKIREAPDAVSQGGETVPAGARDGTGKAEDRYQQGGEAVLARRSNGTGKAEDRYWQGGESATPRTITPPSIARMGVCAEVEVENISFPQARADVRAREERGNVGAGSAEELCEELLRTWEPVLGEGPRGEFQGHRAQWLSAAAALLRRHPRERLEDALAYMISDEILGSQALTMPGFARVADQLIARAYARCIRASAHRHTQPDGGTTLRWEEAKRALERAIQRHGRDGRSQALDELREQNPLLVRFVERVRWMSLCEQPFQYVERRYAELWRELTCQVTSKGEEQST
jgi:hypothetical protein